jgi:hypothetical protein
MEARAKFNSNAAARQNNNVSFRQRSYRFTSVLQVYRGYASYATRYSMSLCDVLQAVWLKPNPTRCARSGRSIAPCARLHQSRRQRQSRSLLARLSQKSTNFA